ncbi:MAG: aconitate hydratase [Candidatus Zixiibacteriota bacterium]|nr:MAG: aconitate hydratase [candidate division Zixibacteria bacterium]
MGMNLAEKILSEHLTAGKMIPGEDIAIKIDQTLTQDATGTMAYLQFEALGLKKVKTELSVSYVDHNMLQASFENADDHQYLQSVAAKYGIYFSRPGNGICHQVHLERFGVPGKTMLGSDSHTPTSGGIGMIAIGAGGLDVAVAMGGGPFYMKMPEIINVRLTGKLKPFVTAKDIILEVLRILTVKGGVGKIIEYGGPGVASLSIPERATITNMGAELGATTSVFPTDERTREYLSFQKRVKAYRKLEADPDARYSRIVEIDLNKLEPLIARPHSPDNVIEVRKLKNVAVNQVCVGSCTNSSLSDLLVTAKLLKGKRVHPGVSMTVTPGSKQVFEAIAASGALTEIIAAGARIIESACGPCIGMGQAPGSGGVSVRSFNRNFPGRSGTKDANVYLASPETCVAAALAGKIADPRKLGKYPRIVLPKTIKIDDSGILPPSKTPAKVEIKRGPNIAPLPLNKPMADSITGEVLLKVGDNITTDHIMPAGAKVLPLRSNIPKISEFVYYLVDADFSKRAKEKGGGFIVGGDNYGQGSSREHAALAPMYLGIKLVAVKSFARIHLANLINFGILPAIFADPGDYDKIGQGDRLELPDIKVAIAKKKTVEVFNKTGNQKYILKIDHLTERQRTIIIAGGLLNYTRSGGN